MARVPPPGASPRGRCPPVGFCHAARNGEPQSGPARAPVARGLEPDKRFHDGIAILGANAGAAIVDHHHYALVTEDSRDARLEPILNGVVDKV